MTPCRTFSPPPQAQHSAEMADEISEVRNNARLVILELANMIAVPMSLNAIVHLNVPDAIWQGGANDPLSASEILSRVLPSGGDPDNLQRLLRMLTSYDIFSEHINGSERKYSLTDIGKTLVSDEQGLSYKYYVLQHHQDALMKAWPLVHEAVLDPSVEPFVKANGEPAYELYGKIPEMNEMMQKSMAGMAVPFMKAMLASYDGFEGVKRLVDLGGSAGDSLRMILAKHPSIEEGINFDMPDVVANAPKIPGVTHVGGDMSKSVPHGDAIFIKGVLLAMTDEECEAIMRNCYDALPAGGKVIACEIMMPKASDGSHKTRAMLECDVFVMTIYRTKGKVRTEQEFRRLGLSTGFTHFRAFYFDHFYPVLEFRK